MLRRLKTDPAIAATLPSKTIIQQCASLVPDQAAVRQQPPPPHHLTRSLLTDGLAHYLTSLTSPTYLTHAQLYWSVVNKYMAMLESGEGKGVVLSLLTTLKQVREVACMVWCVRCVVCGICVWYVEGGVEPPRRGRTFVHV